MRILVTIAMSDPEPRTPAPGSLLLVQQFLNSYDMPDGVDGLETPQRAADWLTTATGVAIRVSDKERGRLVATREALRNLLEAHTGENVDPAVRVRLQKLLGHAALAAHLHGRRRDPCRRLRRCGQLPRHDLHGDRRGHPDGKLGSPEDLPQRHVPVGVLRPLQEWLQLLVLDARVWHQREGAGISSPAAPGGSYPGVAVLRAAPRSAWRRARPSRQRRRGIPGC